MVTARVWAGPLPQLFDGVTVIFPGFVPIVTVAELVVLRGLGVHPGGKFQVYVTPVTLLTLYVCVDPWQGDALPIMTVDCAGG